MAAGDEIVLRGVLPASPGARGREDGVTRPRAHQYGPEPRCREHEPGGATGEALPALEVSCQGEGIRCGCASPNQPQR